MFTFLYTFTMIVTLSNIPRLPYLYNGVAYSGGDIMEIVYKSVLGLIPKKDGNTPFDKGCDIPELNRSVKSKGFTLTDRYLGETKEQIINAYMEKVVATTFAYCMIDITTNTLRVYVMDKAQFKTFLMLFGTLERNSKNGNKKLRVKHETSKLIKWLEQNARD